MTTDSPSVDVSVGDGNIDVSSSNEQQIVTADSSTAEGAKPASPLEAVKAALSESKDDVKSVAATEESPTKDGEKAVKANSDQAATDDEDKDLPFHKHARWQEMKAERNALREQVQVLNSRAQAFDQVSGAVRQAGLSAEEFNQGFEIMRLMKSDPMAALAALKPYFEELQKVSGEVLPADLQAKVDQGFIDPETATEMAKLRSTSNLATQRLQQTEQQQSQQAAQDLQNAMGSSVTAWEQSWAKTDPDYQKKQPLVKSRIIELMNMHGHPRTPEQAVFVANRAKADVEEYLKGMIPTRQSVRTVTGGASNGSGTPTAKTPLDAARLAAQGKYNAIGI